MPHALNFDLLDASLYLELSREPHRLEALIGNQKQGTWIILDEIQKVPPLLDEVHRLMEKHKWNFALCGSSARKLRRGGANLLAGRALTLAMESFSAFELKDAFKLEFAMNWGMLPFVWNDPNTAADILAAYVNTYLKEELQAEGIIRSVPPFLRFLAVAGQLTVRSLMPKTLPSMPQSRAVRSKHHHRFAYTMIGTFFRMAADQGQRNSTAELFLVRSGRSPARRPSA
jgi:hypothetical protein